MDLALQGNSYWCSGKFSCMSASWDSSVGRASAGLWPSKCWVLILPLPVIPEVTLGSHLSCSLTVPRCKLGQVWDWKFRVDPEEDHYAQVRPECRPPWL